MQLELYYFFSLKQSITKLTKNTIVNENLNNFVIGKSTNVDMSNIRFTSIFTNIKQNSNKFIDLIKQILTNLLLVIFVLLLIKHYFIFNLPVLMRTTLS